MYLGYNTNGLAHHRLEDAIRLLAEIGYQGVAITIDHGALSPNSATLAAEVEHTRDLLRRLKMRCVIETGARYLLDYRRKHFPTLLSADPADRDRRIAFLEHSIRVARALDADCVSFWSGAADDAAAPEICYERLLPGLRRLAEFAAESGVVLAFEPEPGMFIDLMTRFDDLQQRLGKLDPPGGVQLTLDVGHLHCQGELPIANVIQKYAAKVHNIHIEDMRRGVHEHLMFGDGEMEISPILRALEEISYRSGVYVELSRHSHAGPETALRAYSYLKPLADWKV